MRRTLKVGTHTIGEVAVADDDDPKIRRGKNLILTEIAISRALSEYRPEGMSPETRYHVILADVTRTVMGVADEKTLETVRNRFDASEGEYGYLWAQIYRSSGSNRCSICGKPYVRHPLDERVNRAANLLCTGDLVHL